MTFAEALPRLLAGDRIRPPHWGDEGQRNFIQRVHLVTFGKTGRTVASQLCVLGYSNDPSDAFLMKADWTPDYYDLLRDDWEVF